VRRQIACGIDSVNDGELGKTNFTNYVRERIAGIEMRDYRPGVDPAPSTSPRAICGSFPVLRLGQRRSHRRRDAKAAELLRRAAELRRPRGAETGARGFPRGAPGVKAAEAFLPANTPGTVEHWLRNEHYRSDEEFVYAIAEALRDEYKAIADAGFLLQIDDPIFRTAGRCTRT